MPDLNITIELRIPVRDEVQDYDEGQFGEFLDEVCGDIAFAADAVDSNIQRWAWHGE